MVIGGQRDSCSKHIFTVSGPTWSLCQMCTLQHGYKVVPRQYQCYHPTGTTSADTGCSRTRPAPPPAASMARPL